MGEEVQSLGTQRSYKTLQGHRQGCCYSRQNKLTPPECATGLQRHADRSWSHQRLLPNSLAPAALLLPLPAGPGTATAQTLSSAAAWLT
jgi:hypothetical protein